MPLVRFIISGTDRASGEKVVKMIDSADMSSAEATYFHVPQTLT